MKWTEEGTAREVTLGDVRLHYHMAGAGETVVMLHGGGPGAAGWTNFHRNVDAFAAKHHVLIPDMPGFGRSSKPHYTEQIGQYNARLLKNWLDQLGIERAHFVGNSMGGHIALKFALDYPDRTGRLVLMAPAIPVATLSSNPTEGAKVLRTYYHGSGPSLDRMRQFLQALVYAPEQVSEETLKERYERSIEPEIVDWSKRNAPSPDRFEPLWKEISEVQSPVLLIWGRDDRVVTLDRALFMLHQLRDVRLHVFGRCGHWAMIEHSEAFNAVCLDFMAESGR